MEVWVYGSPDTVARMKTTIELPDALAQQAKNLAREQGVTLRELVVDGLRAEVQRRSTPRTQVDFHFPTFEGAGLQPGVTYADLISYAYDSPA
jgi:hypothetical protein